MLNASPKASTASAVGASKDGEKKEEVRLEITEVKK
jgi:hypothetical protein